MVPRTASTAGPSNREHRGQTHGPPCSTLAWMGSASPAELDTAPSIATLPSSRQSALILPAAHADALFGVPFRIRLAGFFLRRA